MKNVFAAALSALLISACGAQQTGSTTQDAGTTHMWECSGFNLVDAAGSADHYEVVLDRVGYDLKPGVPVMVLVRNRFDSNTATPSEWRTVVNSKSRLTAGESGFSVKFPGGSLEAAVGNSGITGISPRYEGVLTLSGKSIHVNCPVRK
ncbi:MAG: hypothetical protein NTV34_03120 [Proteobacteria bacterium]|nr:hypothetical protein [Pseudomonadota bacterium]